jgi:hypothetical protein
MAERMAVPWGGEPCGLMKAHTLKKDSAMHMNVRLVAEYFWLIR